MAAQFSWAAGADVLGGVANAFASWASADANRTLARANADAANTIRKAQNEQRASALGLAATVRSLADKAILTNAGEQFNSAGELIARTQAAAVRGDVEQGIRNAESLGAFAARAAAAGVGGSSIHAVSYTVRLQQARLAERTDQRNAETTYELLKQRSGIMPAAVSRLDISPLSPNFDYSTTMPPSGGTPNLLAYLMQGVLSKRESLQVALDSIVNTKPDTTQLPTGNFSRMDRGQTSSIFID